PQAAGKNPQSCFAGQTGGQKFPSPKTPFLFARLLWRAGENLRDFVLPLPRPSRARATKILP
ncbi:MAG: hypothetical protein COZ64_02470, partial [Candidatus Brennerbacteria bacterium CG_4_8_14_3_um_filter_43_14]